MEEIFDKLIPVIVLIVWTIAAARKKKKPQGTPAPKQRQKASPLLDALRNTLDSAIREMNLPAGGGTVSAPKSAPVRMAPVSKKTRIEQHATPAPAQKKISAEAMDVPPEIMRISEGDSSAPRMPQAMAEPETPLATETQDTLQDAIIWSELLGKPVSLRE